MNVNPLGLLRKVQDYFAMENLASISSKFFSSPPSLLFRAVVCHSETEVIVISPMLTGISFKIEQNKGLLFVLGFFFNTRKEDRAQSPHKQ